MEALLVKKVLAGIVLGAVLLISLWMATGTNEVTFPVQRKAPTAKGVPFEGREGTPNAPAKIRTHPDEGASTPPPAGKQKTAEAEASTAIKGPETTARTEEPAVGKEDAPGDGVTVEGIVVTETADGESPVADAMILVGTTLPALDSARVTAVDARTAADGRFRVDNVSPEAGLYVYALHPHYAPGWEPLPPESVGTATVRIVLSVGGVLAGIVTVGGRPAAEAVIRVEAYSTLGQVTSGLDGHYLLAGITPGKLLVTASLPGQTRSLLYSAIVEAGRETQVDFAFSEALSSVEGVISVNGKPAAAGVVILTVSTGNENEVFRSSLQSGGTYVFDKVTSGAGVLRATATLEGGGEASKHVTLEIPENENIVQNVEILLGTVLRGNITIPDTTKDGVVMALKGEVEIKELSTEFLFSLEPLIVASGSITTGSYRFEGLKPGTYTLVALAYTELPGSDENAIASMLSNALFSSEVVSVKEGAETVVDLVPERS